MRSDQFTIGFVRRGFSSGGGAEAYLTRLAGGVAAAGHRVSLYTAGEWPANEWNFGPVVRLGATSAVAFADEMEKISVRRECNVLMSLERLWRCDVYRAGDGVHRAWLDRRGRIAGPLQKLSRLLNRKHSATLSLEESLFGAAGAKHVIANSRMVKEEIIRFYGFPAEKIDVVYNGVPLQGLHRHEEDRAKSRERFGLEREELAVLFAGSGWERKGLRFAIEALERLPGPGRLLVAGRGDSRKFPSNRVQFLGVVPEMRSLYAAADVFLLPTVYDPFSNACLEALAAGLPIITTQANGFSEIIESGKHGAVIDRPDDVEAIGNALQFWSDPARRAQAEIDNLVLAAQFDISRKVEETLQVLARFAA
jgi:UDP-glucose:(heptosyl)LPS alpha-1,3-glucosyltransferase